MSIGEITASFYAYFPLEVLKDENLSATDRLLIVNIIRLDNDKGCYASNEYLASFVGCTPGTVSKSVSKLYKLGYIISNEEYSGRTYVRRVRLDLKNHNKNMDQFHHHPMQN